MASRIFAKIVRNFPAIRPPKMPEASKPVIQVPIVLDCASFSASIQLPPSVDWPLILNL